MRQGVRAEKQEQRLLHEGVQGQAERKRAMEVKSIADSLKEGDGETEHLANEPYTIKVKYHEGASRIGSDIHGVMCDLSASETVELKQGEVKVIPLGVSMKLPYSDFGIVVPRSSTCLKHGILMANSIGIIENEYCGDGDVWGFVAYAIRDTVIERGTRIAQFMPAPFIPDWNTIIFEEVESMGCADRGGYGSTGERSAEGQTAEGRTFRDANGLELHVGDFVTDELVDCYCVMGLNISDGDAYADIGNGNASVKVALCRDLELDERPHDCDGVPIDIGDVLYRTDPDGEPIGDPLEVEGCIDGAFFAKGLALPINARACTHREPDSFEKIANDALMDEYGYCDEFGLDYGDDSCPAEYAMHGDLVRRMEAVAARG